MQRAAQQFSLEVHQLASDNELGEPLREYRWKFTRISLIGISIGVAFSALWVVAFFRNPPEAVQDTPFFGTITVLWLALFFYRLYFHHYWYLYTYTQGFIILKRSKVDIFHWEEVDTFRRTVIHVNSLARTTPLLGLLFLILLEPVICRYKIKCSDGKSLVLTYAIKEAEQIGKILNSYITEALLPTFLEMYAEGGEIAFGPLSISQAGISKGNNLLPWDEIQMVELTRNFVGEDNNVLSINKVGRGRWTMPVPTIPDVSVFVALARHALQKQSAPNSNK